MADASVLYKVTGGVATITLNRPDVLNALDNDLVAQMADHAESAAKDPDVWVVAVRGAGRAFCSGMDRKALSAGRIGEAFYRHWIRGLNCLEDMDKLVIGVLHGYSIGGGLQLAVACDLRLAADDAILGLGATRHGLVPDGSILRLARIIGLEKHEFVSSVALTFFLYKLVQLGAVSWYGLLSWPLLWASLGLTAISLAGFALGLRVQDRLEQRTFNSAVLAFLGLLGVWLLVSSLR